MSADEVNVEDMEEAHCVDLTVQEESDRCNDPTKQVYDFHTTTELDPIHADLSYPCGL